MLPPTDSINIRANEAAMRILPPGTKLSVVRLSDLRTKIAQAFADVEREMEALRSARCRLAESNLAASLQREHDLRAELDAVRASFQTQMFGGQP